MNKKVVLLVAGIASVLLIFPTIAQSNRMDDLEAEVASKDVVEGERDELAEDVDDLRDQVEGLGGTPVAPPPEETVEDGRDGLPGVDGRDGADGPPGPVGPAGPEGKQGPPGPVGPKGDPGEDGVDGADGTDGVNGADGADGANGVDGAPGRGIVDQSDVDVFLSEIMVHEAPDSVRLNNFFNFRVERLALAVWDSSNTWKVTIS